jgi:hypothetical protein
LGGILVYLFDPISGEERRQRLSSLWRENRSTVLETAKVTGQQVQAVKGTVGDVGAKVGDVSAKVSDKVAELRARNDGQQGTAPAASGGGSASGGTAKAN